MRLVLTTGRKLLLDALREPMAAVGWSPRAAGWFTLTLNDSKQGVIALATASKHEAPGTATATMHVHVRDDAVEDLVSQMCTSTDEGYRTTTATTSIGYLMPARSWQEWLVTADSVEDVAIEMSAAVREYVEPYVRRLASDSTAALAAVKASPAYRTAVGLGRAVVLLGRAGDVDMAKSLMEERLGLLDSRSDAAALQERKCADALRVWLATPRK